ncbi:MAG: DUF2147 domain-containing protein [Pseudomonadota bacterium]
MTLRQVLAIAATMLVPISAPMSAVASTDGGDPAFGYWLTENGKAIVEFAPCGSKTCGRMVWVANPNDDQGKPKLDVANLDEAKRGRPICGLDLVGGLDADGPGAWTDGWIYNPRDGSTYSANIQAISGDKLKVRGYLGLSLLGSSQTWTRVANDRGGC